ncbi:MAG: DNA replication and repair protein RecF [Gemmatimonadales bacterium]|nr:DNA replication and repair protein RecF [Candidatus Palauibacter irciniicola]MYC19006.1 DNA replication and repair protein RecF [Gemmatimonadales bacterium]
MNAFEAACPEALGQPPGGARRTTSPTGKFPCGIRLFAVFFKPVTKTPEAPSIRQPEASSAPFLRRLILRDYRNFERLECEFPEAGVAIIGPNGSGKTNLLEAICYLEVFRSFRGVRDRELVRFGQTVFRVEGEVEGGTSVAAAYDRSQRIKKVEVDALEVERVSAGIGSVGVAAFRLDDAEIVRGGPTLRRRFLDIALSVGVPDYLPALQRYRSLLSQRNEALRRGGSNDEIEAWTEGLVEAGGVLTERRATWVSEGAERYADYYARISGGDSAGLRYSASIASDGGPEGAVSWEDRFRSALERTGERERRQGMTVVGPHRDEIRFEVEAPEGPRDLRSYGSSGQQRTAALALRLLEADRLRERLGREPLYLLDDVFAELDEGRSDRLFRLFESERGGQVILTAPKTGDVGLMGGKLARWRLRNGRIIA